MSGSPDQVATDAAELLATVRGCSTSLQVEHPRWTRPRNLATSAGSLADRSASRSTSSVPESEYGGDFRYGVVMATIEQRRARSLDLGYMRVSTTRQSLERQLDALAAAGIPTERIYSDKKTGTTLDRPGLNALLGYARDNGTVGY